MIRARPAPQGTAASGKDAQWLAATDDRVMQTLGRVFPALMIFGFVIPAVQILLRPPREAGFLIGATVVAALAFVSFHFLFKRGAIPNSWAHQVGAVIAGILLLRSLLHLYLAADREQTGTVVLLVFAAGCILLSTRWLAIVLAGALAGWAIAAAAVLSPHPWTLLAGALGVATVISVKIHSARLRSHRSEYFQRLEEERRRRESQHREQRYARAVWGANDGLWYWDLTTDEIEFSPQWAAMLGHDQAELGTSPEDWFGRVHPYYLAGLQMDLAAHLNGSTAQFENEHRLRHKDGSYLWALCRGIAMRDSQGKATSIAGSLTDISRLIDIEQRLLHDALHDRLTGLPNRNFLMARLETAIDRKKREGSNLFAVIFLDLDRFKVINDSLGHLVGDQLLAAAASRLRSCQRNGDLVARLGGDEFVVLMEKLKEPADATRAAARIQKALEAPFQLGEHEVVTSASIGIALSTARVERPEDVLRNADIAMYDAKSRLKEQHVQIFNSEMHDRTVQLWRMQNDLRRALERDEFRLLYQPFISLRTGRISGVEALLRWHRSNGEVVPPALFIPVAEEMGLIVDIGEWVLRTACSQNQAWQQAGIPARRIAVNLSVRQLRKEDFVETVKSVLAETGLEPKWLELELTESALIDKRNVAPKSLHALSDIGIRLSIDDFGTGYCSLDHLKQYSFETLKIAPSFIADIPHDGKTAALARGLINLAHSLDLKVTAEGVERQEQLVFLRSHGCDKIQGFLASEPVSAEKAGELLRSDPRLLSGPDAASGAATADQIRADLGNLRDASAAPGEKLTPVP